MKYSKDRTIDAKVKDLVRDGWSAWRGARHWRVVHPDTGFAITVPGTPGDHRSVRNWMAQFNRAERVGFDVQAIFGGRQ
jgi:predicted RNA binding protein YcfA (HicA-like mRNA interferase family)